MPNGKWQMKSVGKGRVVKGRVVKGRVVKGRVVKGRGASSNTPNRYERIQVEDDFEHLESSGGQEAEGGQRVRTEYFQDHAQSIIASNNSPDVPFRFSINPYRGCEHGCAY